MFIDIYFYITVSKQTFFVWPHKILQNGRSGPSLVVKLELHFYCNVSEISPKALFWLTNQQKEGSGMPNSFKVCRKYQPMRKKTLCQLRDLRLFAKSITTWQCYGTPGYLFSAPHETSQCFCVWGTGGPQFDCLKCYDRGGSLWQHTLHRCPCAVCALFFLCSSGV